MVQAREGADGVAGVGPHAKFADPPDVDGDPHNSSVNRMSNGERHSSAELQPDQDRLSGRDESTTFARM